MFENITYDEKSQIRDLLRKAGSQDASQAIEAQTKIAAELQKPIRQGVLTGDIIGSIFQITTFDPGVAIQYPIDFYRPDNANEFVAYTVPNEGRIPQKQVEGDYVNVPTYRVANSIDMLLKYVRDARWDVLGRAMEVMEAGFVKKFNNDAWHTILSAGQDRGILVSDANATAGQFTKALVTQLQLVMKRNGGGNSASNNRSKLTDLYISPEAMEDIRNWSVDQIDEITRREIYVAQDDSINRIFGVNLRDLDELGEGQEYQDFYDSTLSGSMAASDVEIVVGLDLSQNDSFVMPVTEDIQIFPDPYLHREGRIGFYGWGEVGFGALNSVRVLLGSL